MTSQFPGLREESEEERATGSKDARREKMLRKRKRAQADLQELKLLKASYDKGA